MNPRLVKFVVEMQNPEQAEKEKTKEIFFRNSILKNFYNKNKYAKVTIPIEKNS